MEDVWKRHNGPAASRWCPFENLQIRWWRPDTGLELPSAARDMQASSESSPLHRLENNRSRVAQKSLVILRSARGCFMEYQWASGTVHSTLVRRRGRRKCQSWSTGEREAQTAPTTFAASRGPASAVAMRTLPSGVLLTDSSIHRENCTCFQHRLRC